MMFRDYQEKIRILISILSSHFIRQDGRIVQCFGFGALPVGLGG